MSSVWDLRAFKKPLATRSEVTTLYPATNAIFSPDDKYVLTGAGATSKGDKGRLMFLRKDTLESVKELEVDTTPVKVFWHSKINQVCFTPLRPQLLLTLVSIDRNRSCEWPNLCLVFTAVIHQWGETTSQQRATPQGHD